MCTWVSYKVKLNQRFNYMWIRRQIKCKGKNLMLFYGGTFLHYKKFVNKFLWLCAHAHKIFRSCAHCTCAYDWWAQKSRSFLAKITSLTSFRAWPHLNRFFLNRDLKIIMFNLKKCNENIQNINYIIYPPPLKIFWYCLTVPSLLCQPSLPSPPQRGPAVTCMIIMCLPDVLHRQVLLSTFFSQLKFTLLKIVVDLLFFCINCSCN